MRRTRDKRRKRGAAPERHFIWLARRQILGEGNAAIAELEWPIRAPKGSIGRSKVQKAVKLLAADIGLTLRQL